MAACCHSSGYSDQPGQLDEIVGSHCQRELEVQLLHATQHWPRQSANGLAPPEWLLDPFALLLADLVSAVADSATVDGGELIGRVLRHVRCNVEVPHVGYKVSRIEALVGAHGDAPGAGRIAHDHVFRGFALDRARHLPQFRLDDEAVAVLGHDIARIGELCLLTFALLGEFGLRIRDRAVCLIAALLTGLQAKIKRTLMSDQLTPNGSSPLTATEISARVNVYRSQLGSVFSRLTSEYLQALLDRVWGLSLRSGLLNPAPEELMQATRINFQFINPMAAAQRLEGVTAIQNLMINVGQMAQIDPTIMDNINLDHAVQIIGEGLNVPTDVIRTQEDIAQLRQTKQEQQQAMQEQQQQQALMSQVGSTGLEIAKDQAKNMTPEQLGAMLEQ